MNVLEDASTPAVAASANASSVTSLATASFSPPASTLLVAMCIVNYNAAPGSWPALSMSDTAGGTWTPGPTVNNTAGGALVAFFTRPVTSAPGFITATFSRGADSTQAKLTCAVRVCRNARTSQAGAASNTASSSTADPAAALTTTAAGSAVYVIGDAAGSGSGVTPNGATSQISAAFDSGDGGYLLLGNQTPYNTGTPGAETLGWTYASTSGHAIAALEILPATTWALVQSLAATPVTGTANPLSAAATFGASVTARNRIFVYTNCNFTTADVNAPTDSQGNIYTKLTGSAYASSAVVVDIWTAVASATGSLTITVTVPNASGSLGWTAEEYSGLSAAAAAGCLNVAAAGTMATSTGPWPSGTTSATGADGQLALSAAGDWGAGTVTFAAGSGFTLDSGASVSHNGDANIAVASKVSAAGAAESCSWSDSSVSTRAVAVVAVIKARPWNVVQSNSATVPNSASVSAAYRGNLGTGNVLLAVVTGASATSVADGSGNQFAKLANAGSLAALWVLPTPAGDAGAQPSITASFTGNQSASLWIAEAAGVQPAIDGTAGTATGAGSTLSPSYTSGAVDELLLAVLGDNGGPETAAQSGSGYVIDVKSVNNNGSSDAVVAYKSATGAAESDGWALTGTLASKGAILAALRLQGAVSAAHGPLMAVMP